MLPPKSPMKGIYISCESSDNPRRRETMSSSSDCASPPGTSAETASIPAAEAEPWQAFFRKDVPRRLKSGGFIERTDMNMHFSRAFTFARQSGPALCAEATQPAGRRIEFCYLAFCNGISVTPECYEHGDRRTAMPATALAMAPGRPYRLTGSHKSHRPAQAPALTCAAHLVIPPLLANRGLFVDREPASGCRLNR